MSCPFRPSRRRLIGLGAAALAAPPLLAQVPVRFSETARELDQLHSLVVRREGEEVFAEAFGGPGLDAVANVKSVSKTLLALLTGIAIERGVLDGTNERVMPLLGRGPFDDARDSITVGDLLSMRAGLESVSGGNYGAWVSSGDWVGYALDQGLAAEPGGRFIYSTGGWHLLGVALARAADRPLLALARDWLGDPLGVDFAPWVADPQGNYLGGNDMGLSPRGLARIGQAVLNGGRHDGAQVIPEDWIARSWEPNARSPFSNDRYGYGWFLTSLSGTPVRYGRGYGGQILAVAPERDTVIAITSDPTRPARSGGYFGDLKALMTDIL
ncbi:serine hydrolase domain-containing protein [Roseivivax sediminis]|uniref:CubicO group peptidase, beta-lactamase class C family n=1 Tax=Roseivivax sediminis TaxID=936889 RepID=A0A1I1WY10_9RHOB|nr:serine hydrolase [Roseivivax sediminis]SFD99871.1 CubicO group peptidase, beta-lactamase class C family [Roseivivax sediminis]